MAIIYYLVVSYWQQIQDLEYKKWDIDTCTPADYTVKMTISKDMWAKYKDGVASGAIKEELHDIIAEKLEEKSNSLDAVFESHSDHGLKVAAVTVGYKNGSLIRKLKTRGALIANGQFHKVPAEDAKINSIVKH